MKYREALARTIRGNSSRGTVLMDLMKKDSRQQSGPFVLTDFAAREHRRTERLVRAAYGVGHTLPWFVAMNRPAQGQKSNSG